MTNSLDPIHPGDVLAEELNATGMSTRRLAGLLGMGADCIEQLIEGQESVTADLAVRLGRFFGTGPELWLDLQTAYVLETQYQSRL